ncbi:MAG: prepilin-type N-terminal cleavage/methylation domain-containing protein [bacterium]
MNKLTNKLKLQKGQSGFTIIEVLIVLAIGALIILAVLLAVPALQRNQANSQRKSEASRVAAAATQYMADANNPSTLDATKIGDIAKLDATGKLTTVAVALPGSGNLSKNTAYVLLGKTCSGTTVATGTATQIAVVYVNQDVDSTTPSACINSRI